MRKPKSEEEPKAEEPTRSRGGSESIKRKGEKGLLIPISPEAHKDLRLAAGIEGLSMSAFAREAILEKIREVIAAFKSRQDS